jgi:L-rhamnose-H+ transport protein
MESAVAAGALLAVLSGIMNGVFTLPMRFLGRWAWENVWTVFITGACLLLPAVILSATAPWSWHLLTVAPGHASAIAVGTGFAWGFGAIMFGQSVSAIGISLANTFVLAVSSALGSLLPMIFLTPAKLHEHAGHMILAGIAVEIFGIVLCGRAGMMRERAESTKGDRGDLVGKARPMAVALLLVTGSGVLSAVFNIGFALAQPIATFGQQNGLTLFEGTNLIWVLMLAGGAISNLGFCAYLVLKNRSAGKFTQTGSLRLYTLGALMALLWGGSIFVYGAAAPRLGALGASIGWPLSLATGLLVANAVGIGLGEWKHAPGKSLQWMYSGIAVLLFAIVVLSRASY